MKMVCANLKLNKILEYGKLSRREQEKPNRRVFLYHKALSEDWEAYSVHVERTLFKKGQDKNAESSHITLTDINVE